MIDGPERARRIFRGNVDSPKPDESKNKIIDTSKATLIPDVVDKKPKNSNRNFSQNFSSGMLEFRTIVSHLIKGDPESQRLIKSYFQEEIEGKYLEASIRTDHKRIQNLKSQVDLVNVGLSKLTGKDTTLLGLYNKISQKPDSDYPPIRSEDGTINVEGIFGLLRFHQELTRKLFSASETASEGAEIDAQKALVPLREELNRITIDEKKKTAVELVNAKSELVEGEVAEGEIFSSKIRGKMIPIITAVAEAPVIFLQAPVDRLSKWMNESEDKAIPVTAVLGAIGGPLLLFTKVADSSIIINHWLVQNTGWGIFGGIFGGALGFVALWKATEAVLPVIGGKLSDLKKWMDSVGSKWKIAWDNSRKAKKADSTSQKSKKEQQE